VASKSNIQEVLNGFGLGFTKDQIKSLGNGHINQTYLLDGPVKFVLQRINTKVFTRPEIIASNLRNASQYLIKNFPGYLFLNATKTKSGEDMMYDAAGHPWRLFPYINNTTTLESVSTPDEAFEAARGFAALTQKLDGVAVRNFYPTIDRFQDLTWRFEQLQDAIRNAGEERKLEAESAIEQALGFAYLVDEYVDLIKSGKLRLRVVHNDTKINNILFDSRSNKAVAVIDLDTLMPGYFIYDLGDMVRTFVSPVSEEETDLTKVAFRFPFYQKLLEGYLSEMDDCLTDDEKKAIPFAGLMMTYIMAIRFLADYLNGDIYYNTEYPGQNLVRASNQLRLLSLIKQNVSPDLGDMEDDQPETSNE
jgi:Ser/Thr protein kinase RdoA (MazF antagonist)